MNDQIITSLLDDDAYKAHMRSAMWGLHRNVTGEYAYTCRSKDVDLRPIAGQLQEQMDGLKNVPLLKAEADWLYNSTKATNDYIRHFLAGHRMDSKQLLINHVDGGCGLTIRTAPDVPIYEGSGWEMPVMSTISELYFRSLYGSRYQKVEDAIKRRLEANVDELLQKMRENPEVPFTFTEFGTRRRFSKAVQKWALQMMLSKLPKGVLLGTSNMALARELAILAFGTMAHEWLMMYQALVHPIDSQTQGLKDWIEFFRGQLGLALTDTLGDRKWALDFDGTTLAEDYTGQRHDSGKPSPWARGRIEAYKAQGLDPKDKTLLFSDSLNLLSAFDLTLEFYRETKPTNGIGTAVTNPKLILDLDGFDHQAVSQVMKLVRVNGRPVAKLSADPAKAMCEDSTHLGIMKWATQFPSNVVRRA